MSTAKHTASGQAAGYLFQPDRALYWLAHSKKGDIVGIETADDITVVSENGDITIREQDKNSVQVDGQPISDRSKDLWNTLFIWVKALESNEIVIGNIGLLFATNKSIPEDALVRKIADADKTNLDNIISVLKTAIKNPPSGIKDKVEYVLNREDLLKDLIPHIRLSDGNSLDDLNDKIISQLHLPEEIASDVLFMLKGWVHDTVVKLWNESQPGFLSREAFDNFLNKAKYRISSANIRERVKRLVLPDVDEEKRALSEQGTFVKQLESITDDEDLLMEAIDDYLCADVERTRLILAGEITGTDFDDFDDKCEERWKEVKRRKIRNGTIDSILSDNNLNNEEKREKLRELGFEIYDLTACSGYNGVLAGYTTTESYLTKGTYYIMSDSLRIGWHPQWESLFAITSND